MSDRIVMITGATGKIGRRLLAHFLKRHWTVIAVGRSKESLASLSDVGAGKLHRLVQDLLKPTQKCIDSLTKQGLIPTALINNARDADNLALSGRGRPTAAQWQKEFHLAVITPYELSLALAETGRLSSVVNVASMYGVVAPNMRLYDNPAQQSPIHYGVAKAAMIHLGRELAVRLAPLGVRVNTVSYGGVEGRVDTDFLARYSQLCPMERMLSEEEVADAVDYLLSKGASGVTGHNLIVDGGWTAW